jgi:hypothetical protein
VDPDANLLDGFARGVMKPPDQPPVSLTDDDIVALAIFVSGGDDLDGARAAIEPARVARSQRAGERRVQQTLSRIRWAHADPERGRAAFVSFGCHLCHDNPNNPDVAAPALAGIGKRLSREDLARWIIAPPQTKMPSYGDCLDLAVVADLCEHLSQL